MKITNFPKPNYKVWDDVKILDQLQVVCLWAELEPSIKASKQESCNAIHRFLEEARKEGLLLSDVVKENINGKLEYNVYFYRKDLIAYAELTGRTPAFLYPETRTSLSLNSSIRSDSSSPPNPAAPPSQAKVEGLPNTVIELSKEDDVQKVQSQADENEQSVISEHEYPKEICNLFDPIPKSALKLNFQIPNFNWDEAYNRAARNGLSKARDGRGKFNPAKIASWLIQKGCITQQRADAILKKALPPRSKHSSIADDYFNKDEIE